MCTIRHFHTHGRTHARTDTRTVHSGVCVCVRVCVRNSLVSVSFVPDADGPTEYYVTQT